jgi:hypothetical protein
MKTSSVRWLLFEYRGLELVIVETVQDQEVGGEGASQYPDRVARKIGIGLMRGIRVVTTSEQA